MKQKMKNGHTYSENMKKTDQTPTVAKTKIWFTTQWDHIYNKYKNGDKPKQIDSEDNLTNTISNTGDKFIHIYIYNTWGQDDPGGPYRIPTYTKGDW